MATGQQRNLFAFLALMQQGIGNALAFETPDDKTCFVQMSVAQQGKPRHTLSQPSTNARDTYYSGNTSSFPKAFSSPEAPEQQVRGPFDWLRRDNHIIANHKTPKVSKMKFLDQWKARFPGSNACVGAPPHCLAVPFLVAYENFEMHDVSWTTNANEREMSAASNWDTQIEQLFGRDAVSSTRTDEIHPNLQIKIDEWCTAHPGFQVYAPPESLGPADPAHPGRGQFSKVDLADAHALQRIIGPYITEITSNTDLDQIDPRVCDPTLTYDERMDLLKITPEMRAISVFNLKNILEFIKKTALVNAGGYQPEGWFVNPSILNGKGCSQSRYRGCTVDADCGAGGGTCTTQRRMTIHQVNMYMLKDLFVKPVTHYSQLSLVEHIGGGVPHFFVSHAWGSPFEKFVGAVLTHFNQVRAYDHTRTEENTFYWVCTFGVNQHKADQEVGNSIYGPFWYGIQYAQMVISIQDDEQALQLFTGFRSWCVFELAVAKVMKKEWRFICTTDRGAIFEESGYSVRNQACNRNLATALLTWDITQAGTGTTPEAIQNRLDINGFVRVSHCHNVGFDVTPITNGEDCIQLLTQRYGLAIALGCGAGAPGKSRVLSWPFGQTARGCTCEKADCIADSAKNLIRFGNADGYCPTGNCIPYNDPREPFDPSLGPIGDTTQDVNRIS